MTALTRRLSMIALLVAVGGWALFNPSLARADGKIVYLGIGGTTQDALRTTLFEPFTKETGVQVVEDSGLSPERVQAEVQSGHPTIDFMTIDSAAYETLRAANLLSTIDYKYYDPNDIKSMPASTRLEYAV